jgi:Domain of unknown function (DUF4158)
LNLCQPFATRTVDLEPCDPLRQGSIVQHWQLPFLGLQAFPTELTAFEIGYFFTFAATVCAAIFSRYGDHHRLAVAIQIGFIKMAGRPLDAFDTLPIAVLRHLGTELDIVTPESASLRALYGRRSTLYEHQTWATELKPRHDLCYTSVHVCRPCLLTQSPCVAVAYLRGCPSIATAS